MLNALFVTTEFAIYLRLISTTGLISHNRSILPPGISPEKKNCYKALRMNLLYYDIPLESIAYTSLFKANRAPRTTSKLSMYEDMTSTIDCNASN